MLGKATLVSRSSSAVVRLTDGILRADRQHFIEGVVTVDGERRATAQLELGAERAPVHGIVQISPLTVRVAPIAALHVRIAPISMPQGRAATPTKSAR